MPGKKWWNCISNLRELLGLVAHKMIVVWKGLEPCSFPNSEAATLRWIWMDEVVPVFGDVASNG